MDSFLRGFSGVFMSRVPPVGVASPTGNLKKRRIDLEVSSRLCASRQRQDRGISRVFASLQTCVYTVDPMGGLGVRAVRARRVSRRKKRNKTPPDSFVLSSLATIATHKYLPFTAFA